MCDLYDVIWDKSYPVYVPLYHYRFFQSNQLQPI
jgi:hypothetical protein